MKNAIWEITTSLIVTVIVCFFSTSYYAGLVQKKMVEEEARFCADLAAFNFAQKIFPELQKTIPDKTGFDYYYDDLYRDLEKKHKLHKKIDSLEEGGLYGKFLETGAMELWYWAVHIQRKSGRNINDTDFMNSLLRKNTPYFKAYNIQRKLQEINFLLLNLKKTNQIYGSSEIKEIRSKIHDLIININ